MPESLAFLPKFRTCFLVWTQTSEMISHGWLLTFTDWQLAENKGSAWQFDLLENYDKALLNHGCGGRPQSLYVFLAAGRGLSRVWEDLLDQQCAGMGKKAARWGEQGRAGREDGCAQPSTERVALTDPAAGKCPYPGISMNFAYSLGSQRDVFPHLRDEAPQGKIWNFITMQIQLGCCSLTSPSPHPSLLCLKLLGCATILFHISSWSIPEALLDLCRWVYSFNSLLKY